LLSGTNCSKQKPAKTSKTTLVLSIVLGLDPSHVEVTLAVELRRRGWICTLHLCAMDFLSSEPLRGRTLFSDARVCAEYWWDRLVRLSLSPPLVDSRVSVWTLRHGCTLAFHFTTRFIAMRRALLARAARCCRPTLAVWRTWRDVVPRRLLLYFCCSSFSSSYCAKSDNCTRAQIPAVTML